MIVCCFGAGVCAGWGWGGMELSRTSPRHCLRGHDTSCLCYPAPPELTARRFLQPAPLYLRPERQHWLQPVMELRTHTILCIPVRKK